MCEHKTRVTAILVAFILVFSAGYSAAEEPGVCVSDEEAELMHSINNYREANGQTRVAWSKSLTTVAQWHVQDAKFNQSTIFTPNCNLHSWSDWQPGVWQAVCYDPFHSQASLMWSKPREITNNVYTGNGYELGGAGYYSVAEMLSGWQTSSGHNTVMLSQGQWASHPFRAMGIGVDLESRFYYLWFGEVVDPQGEPPLCTAVEPPLFDSGFENGP